MHQLKLVWLTTPGSAWLALGLLYMWRGEGIVETRIKEPRIFLATDKDRRHLNPRLSLLGCNVTIGASLPLHRPQRQPPNNIPLGQ